MAGNLDLLRDSPPVSPADYRWTMSNGQEIRPIVMETSHLFNTVAMLWHHFMPPDAWLYEHKRYHLSKKFTEEYVAASIQILLPELVNRHDLTVDQKRCLIRMMAYLRRHNGRIAEVQRIEDSRNDED